MCANRRRVLISGGASRVTSYGSVPENFFSDYRSGDIDLLSQFYINCPLISPHIWSISPLITLQIWTLIAVSLAVALFHVNCRRFSFAFLFIYMLFWIFRDYRSEDTNNHLNVFLFQSPVIKASVPLANTLQPQRITAQNQTTKSRLGQCRSAPNVAPCFIKRQNFCVSVSFPGSVDSTTVQNIVIIAIASII
jgi:hypothetical protein